MWAVWMLLALAQATPVPQEVVALAEASPCPDVPEGAVPRVVRTSAGLVTYQNDGTYAYACPSRFGDDPGAMAVASPDGRQLMVAGTRGAWFSSNSGCSAEPVPVPETGTVVALLYWRQAFWLLHRDLSVGLSTLFRTDGVTLSAVVSWPDFNPDGMAPEGNDHLWLAGASPLGVRRLGFAGGLSGDVPLADLPTDVQQVRSIVPVAARDGEAWIKLERQTSQWAWHASVRQDGTVRFTDSAERPRVMHGPVFASGGWVSTHDLELHWADPQDPTWSPTDQRVTWTCLQAVGDRVFACTFDGVSWVEGFDGAYAPIVQPVFGVAQITGPSEACGYQSACETDWQEQFEGAPNLLAEEPAVCPDGTTASELDGGGECQCATGPSGWGWWLGLPVWLVPRRHRRASPAQRPRRS